MLNKSIVQWTGLWWALKEKSLCKTTWCGLARESTDSWAGDERSSCIIWKGLNPMSSETQRGDTKHKKERDLTAEKEAGVIRQKSREAGSHQKLGKARIWSSPEPPRGIRPHQHIDFRFLASYYLSYLICYHLSQQKDRNTSQETSASQYIFYLTLTNYWLLIILLKIAIWGDPSI